MTTYQTIIRHYAKDVRAGSADTDLSPRQRRLAEVLLNLASNSGYATVAYPPSDRTRQDVAKSLGTILWDARPLVDATGPAAGRDLETAIDRVFEVLRNI